MFSVVDYTMQRVYPFNTLGQALGFFNRNNPARAKPLNLFEPEGGTIPLAQDLSGESPRDIWAALVLGIARTLKQQSNLEVDVWRMRNVGDTSRQYAVEEISEKIGISAQKIYKILRRINEELEREFVRRELIEPPNDTKHD